VASRAGQEPDAGCRADAGWLGAKTRVGLTTVVAVERFSSAQIKPTGDDAHFDVAHALMNIENPSYQSFSRPQSRAVDVTDLREALGGSGVLIPSSSSLLPVESPNGPSADGCCLIRWTRRNHVPHIHSVGD
jgi:hypothetical protein